MADIYLKPLVDQFGTQFFAVMEQGIKHPTLVMTRIELDQLVEDADKAIKAADIVVEEMKRGAKKS